MLDQNLDRGAHRSIAGQQKDRFVLCLIKGDAGYSQDGVGIGASRGDVATAGARDRRRTVWPRDGQRCQGGGRSRRHFAVCGWLYGARIVRHSGG